MRNIYLLISVAFMSGNSIEALADMESCKPAIDHIKNLSSADPQYLCTHPQEMYEAINRVESVCRGIIFASEIKSMRDGFAKDLNNVCKNSTGAGVLKGGVEGKLRADGSRGSGANAAQGYRDSLDQMAAIALEDSSSTDRDKNSNSNSGGGSKADGSKKGGRGLNARVPKDPNVNYAGQSCSYFTRENDESHIYSYADGVFRLYGNNYYLCEGGYWKFLRTRNTLSREEIRRSEAVNLEK